MVRTLRIGNHAASLEWLRGSVTIEALATVLEPSWILEALRSAGRATKRVRALPNDLVVWLVVVLPLFRWMSIRNVLERLAFAINVREGWRPIPRVTSRAITKARDRVGLDPLKALFARLVESLRGTCADAVRWKGRVVRAIDGTTTKVPDSSENREYFGAPGASRGRSGYPQARLLVLIAAFSHIVLAAAWASWSVGEPTMLLDLLSKIQPGAVVLLDRGFYSFRHLHAIVQRPADFVTRLKTGRCAMSITSKKRIGVNDWLGCVRCPLDLRRRHPHLPEAMPVRLIRYQRRGFRTSHIVTSLLDPGLYPAAEVVALYHDRWEVEMAYDEIKTHLVAQMVTFRSRLPERVLQEGYGILIAYNILRALMARAAEQASVEPIALSFVDCLARVRDHVTIMALSHGSRLPALYDALLAEMSFCHLPPRRNRTNPRAVKVKMSSYALKVYPGSKPLDICRPKHLVA